MEKLATPNPSCSHSTILSIPSMLRNLREASGIQGVGRYFAHPASSVTSSQTINSVRVNNSSYAKHYV
jgi:hypothetical protein